jgi:hypothetical protein
MSDPTPSNTRDNARREAHAERRARPLTRSLTPSATLSPPRNNKVSNHITNQIALTETMTPVASWWGQKLQPVHKWREVKDYRYSQWKSPEAWNREKRRRFDQNALQRQRKIERDATNAIGTSLHPLDAVEQENKSKWPLAERYFCCLQRLAAVERCKRTTTTTP